MLAPIREELTRLGIEELRTAEAVDGALRQRGTVLVAVNSVCGCSAGRMRPAVRLALEGSAVRPEHLYSVFAGQDFAATARAREYFAGHPPSSPSVALLQDGQLVWMLERKDIEMRDPAEIARDMVRAFEQFCAGQQSRAS